MSAFVDLVRRDLRLATRLGGSALTGVLFFLTVVTVIPFGKNTGRRCGPENFSTPRSDAWSSSS